jgi:hypothetical protein
MTYSNGLGSFFRRIKKERVCAGRLRYTTWSPDVTAPAFQAAAVARLLGPT